MGVQLSWESTCLASRGSAVRSRSSPPNNVKCILIQKHSSVGQSTTLIRWGSVVRVHLLLPKHRASGAIFLLKTTAPVYSTVGVGDYAIVVANRWGSGQSPSRESTCFYQEIPSRMAWYFLFGRTSCLCNKHKPKQSVVATCFYQTSLVQANEVFLLGRIWLLYLL